ncbi:hypothetical protein [Mucilaginibacter sp.]|uniref:hypothetical protein n=1 Tax=Mucilaginibacter sp. TaxID=1882438 RepID=UPI003263559E
MKIIYLLFLVFVGSITASLAQTDTSFLSRASASLANQPPAEKVYLHLDKPAYNFSDTIWYKAYTVVGQRHQLSALSGVLYVELISPNDTLIMRQTLKLTSGVAWGDIPLSATLQQGIYRLRAYTKWMRNAGADYFYDQKIRVGGIAVAPLAIKKQIQQRPDIQFFPEGGELVNGVRSRVAFKAVNGNGLGQDIKGTIEDNDGNIVADLASRHLGMGVFAIIPQSGKTYQAKITGAGEAVYVINLPQAKEEGYMLSVNNSGADSVFVKVSVNNKLLKEKQGTSFYLLAQSAGKIYYSAAATLSMPVFGAGMNKSRFPSGIVQFTLFDNNNRPVAERVVFIAGADSLKLQLAAETKVFQSRQAVKFSVSATDSNQPASGSFSMAVINESAAGVDQASESTILNNLLLTSDLKGNIEQPNYYLNNNLQAKADLDLLMLTQGYRRFDWKRALSDKLMLTAFEPERSLQLEGVLKNKAGQPVPAGKISLISTRDNLVTDTVANNEGMFKFTGLELPDTARLVLRARNGNKRYDVNLYIKQPGYAGVNSSNQQSQVVYNSNTAPAASLVKAGQQYKLLQKQDSVKNGIRLKQVNITASKKEKPNIYNGYGSKAPNFKISGKLLGAGSLSWGMALGLKFVRYRDGKFFESKGDQFHILINNIEVDYSEINGYSPADIEDVQMIPKKEAQYAKIFYNIGDTNEIGGGLILITTKQFAGTAPFTGHSKPKEVILADSGKYLTNDPPSGFMAYAFNGFTQSRSFYTPKYSPATPLPDLRSTIYWNPNVMTDKDGLATIEYLNNDSKGTYRVVIEGIDDNGNLGRRVYRYKVE